MRSATGNVSAPAAGTATGCCAMSLQPFDTAGRDHEPARLLGGIHDLQPVDILEKSVGRFACQRGAVTDHADLERHAQVHHREKSADQREQDRAVDERARAQHAAHDVTVLVAAAHRILRRIADQAVRISHFVHHLVAGVDACRAADAFVLQPVADVDTGRAHLHADAAVDAIAQACRLVIRGPAARTARLAAPPVISNHERIGIEHHALEARVGTHVLAHLLAHPAGIAIGRKAVEQHPERLPRPEAQTRHFRDERPDRREITDECKSGP